MEEKLLEKADKVNVGKVILTFIMSVFGIALGTSVGGVVLMLIYSIGFLSTFSGFLMGFLSIRLYFSFGGKSVILATILSILFASFGGYYFHKIAVTSDIQKEITNLEKIAEEALKETNEFWNLDSESRELAKELAKSEVKLELKKVGIDIEKINFGYIYSNFDEFINKIDKIDIDTNESLKDAYRKELIFIYLYMLGGIFTPLFNLIKNKFKKPKSDSLEKKENNTPSTDSSESKDVWVCPKCGASNPVGTMLCQNCEK